ncbi:hypothetical protein EDD18DRAFT_1417294 [Armillaria luteobubalina]|uniref:Heterokaryon incompatibility domain-containing protein n=1 Tax=Armillaria luteobubalina TaxID=153913 RepID=A0AA39PSU4_9AGAR|nr:hypothetical protein EDD18DRAFT_1417294 [Armillaria luteobubalina]
MALEREIEYATNIAGRKSNWELEEFLRPGYRKEYITLPEVTLSAFTETGREELSIEVPKQRSYTGRIPVIPCSLADTPCATLGVQGIFDRLNAILGTSHTLRTAPSYSTYASSPTASSAASVFRLRKSFTGTLGHYLDYQDQYQLSLLFILKDVIAKNYDFGTAYAFLRPLWETGNPRKIRDELRKHEGEDRERRQKALVGNQIVSPGLRPRRVWDLYSNRVVPSWIMHKTIRPISHAWVDESDRVDVRTPINGREWPVPIPKDTDLNLIRIEMLNVGAEYTWLDVLCLRQKDEGGPMEDLRVEEWKLDVPTIGAVYRFTEVVRYLSGLGRLLRLKDGDLDSDRSWFRRAWTLQEVCNGWGHIIAGDMLDGPLHAQQIDGRNYKTALLTKFHEKRHSVERKQDDVFAILGDMRERVSTSPVDRVAGLASLLMPDTIPAYYESKTLEDAWTALVNAMHGSMRAHFLCVYPGVGLGSKKWRPTWGQVIGEPLPKDINAHVYVWRHDEMDEDFLDGAFIDEGYVQGFDASSGHRHSAKEHDRSGKLIIKATGRIMPHTFKIRATHQFLIPEGTYTLLGGVDTYSGQCWAVGRRLPDQSFEKVSVIMMDSQKEVERLKKLSLAQISCHVVLA